MKTARRIAKKMLWLRTLDNVRAILTYHSIDPSGSPISLDAGALKRHVAWLRSGRVEVLPLDKILATPPERDALAITFDDGFANFAEVAWPLFEEHGLPVTLFVATARVGNDNAWDGEHSRSIPTLPLLAWDALGRMVARKLALGSHSRTHAHLPRVSDAQLADELDGSAADIERELGLRPTTFCYPYGEVDARVRAAVAARYACACTTELRVLDAREDPHLLPRLDAYYYRANDRLESFGSAAFRRHLWLRARARRLRAALGG
jgi:peptidoglycan/xylan/chitin deacetylase (PgdA/CDA1 family)